MGQTIYCNSKILTKQRRAVPLSLAVASEVLRGGDTTAHCTSPESPRSEFLCFSPCMTGLSELYLIMFHLFNLIDHPDHVISNNYIGVIFFPVDIRKRASVRHVAYRLSGQTSGLCIQI